MAVRDFRPAFRGCAGRLLPEAAPDYASVSHAEHSTIGSNFCQASFGKKIENREDECSGAL